MCDDTGGGGMKHRAARMCLILLCCLVPAAAPATEDALFRQLKVDLFDRDWEAVLRGCDVLLTRFPHGDVSLQASYYRARALSHLHGREVDAIRAYRGFIRRHPGETVLLEEAWSGIFHLACQEPRPGGDECIDLLREGLASRSSYVSTLAAIQASDQQDHRLRRQALDVLKKAYERQDDADVLPEILIAILKIDPEEVPAPAPATRPATPATPPGKSDAPTMISLTVYNKIQDRFEVRVSLPVGFARILLDALGEEQRERIRRHARAEGIDIDDIFEAIARSGIGVLVEVDLEETRIEVSLE